MPGGNQTDKYTYSRSLRVINEKLKSEIERLTNQLARARHYYGENVCSECPENEYAVCKVLFDECENIMIGWNSIINFKKDAAPPVDSEITHLGVVGIVNDEEQGSLKGKPVNDKWRWISRVHDIVKQPGFTLDNLVNHISKHAREEKRGDAAHQWFNNTLNLAALLIATHGLPVDFLPDHAPYTEMIKLFDEYDKKHGEQPAPRLKRPELNGYDDMDTGKPAPTPSTEAENGGTPSDTGHAGKPSPVGGGNAGENIEFIARVRHLCWACFQLGAGQPYNITPNDDQLESLKNGVQFLLSNENITAEQNHENWMKKKIEQGWKFGPIKDFAAKTHPDLVPFSELPHVERLKDEMDILVTTETRKLLKMVAK